MSAMAAVKPTNTGIAGFQATEVGLIPSDWQVEELGNIGSAFIGLTYRPSDVHTDGTLVLRSSNVQNGRLRFDDNVFVKVDVPDRATVRENDILICVRNGSRDLIGKSAVIDAHSAGMAFGAFMGLYRSEHNNFLAHVFKSNIVMRQIHEHLGATINQITNKSLNGFKVPLPQNPDERKSIAEALSDADALIESLEQLIAKKRQIKQGAMQELLTGKRRLAGFKGEWRDRCLGDLATMKSGEGITSAKIDNSSSYRCYGGNGLRGYTTEYNHDGRYALIGRVGALCGNINIVDGRFFASEHAIVVYPKNDVATDWLAYLLQFANLNRISEASAQPVLTVSKLNKLEFQVPIDKLEQEAIARFITDLNDNITELEMQYQKTSEIKQGMMQELLTGRIRLV